MRSMDVVYFLGPENAENVTESCVSEGWVEVRPGRVAEYVCCLSLSCLCSLFFS